MNIDTSYQPYILNSNLNISQEKINTLDKKKLKEAAQGMEAEFLKVFLKQSKKLMFKEDDEKNKAPGKDIMTDFMFERLAEQMSKTSPLGISEMIIKDVENKQSDLDKNLSQEDITNIIEDIYSKMNIS